MVHSRSIPEGLDLVSVIELATDAIGFDDAEGRIVYANPAFRRLFGVADDEPELGHLEDYVAETSRQDLLDRHEARADGRGGSTSYPFLARRRDGSHFWAEVSVVPVLEQGRFAGSQAVIRDVTEQREREAALRAENQAQATAVDAMPLAVLVLDRSGRVQQWNSAATHVFEWTREEVLGRPYPLAPDELQADHQALLAKVLRERNIEGLETIRRRRDGTAVEVGIWAAAMGGSDERDGRVLEVLVDISKQRRAQQDYRELFERAFDAIVVFEPDTEHVLDVNARACQLYGLSREEFVGMSLQSITQDVARGRMVIDRIQRDGTLHNYETVQRHKDGRELLIESNASLVEYQGRPVVLSINRDLTERRRLQDQLTHMQRMKAVGQLAAGVAHEFNNVLAAILGTAESLLDSPSVVDSPDTRERLQQMIARAETGSRLTRQLLTFSRGGNEERTPIELDQHLRGMTKWLARLLGQDVELVLETRAPGMVVVMDPTQLEQIVLNLSVNARDAMPQGGSLRVHTTELPLAVARAAVTGTIEPGRYIAMEFCDSGPGVPPEVQARLFEPFFSTKERSKGTGLGLATVYTIVDGVGGAIDLHHRVGAGAGVGETGACFTIILPALEREPLLAEPLLPERAEGGHETLLLVDDEPTILAALGQMLRALGYRVLTAPDAVRARRVFEEARGAVDLLLTDVSMPGGSGVELARDLLDRSSTLRVLVMSGYLDAAASATLPRTGFVDKPFTRTSISRRIREILGD